MTDWGIKISKPGYDVKTATVPKHHIFGSTWDTLKIFSQTYKAVTTNVSGVGVDTIAHNLGYKPAFMVFARQATSNTLDGVAYSNCNFVSGSGQFTPFFYDRTSANPSLRDIVVTSDTANINIDIHGAASTTYQLYIYILVDLAEETNAAASLTGNDYGLRISQPGYNVKTAPDYRMIYTSKYPVFHIAKVGHLTLTVPAITLNSGQEDLVAAEVTFDSLGIAAGYHPYLIMIEDLDISLATPASIWMEGGHAPWLPFTGLPERTSHGGAFCTNDRLVLYAWRSYENLGSGASFTFGADTTSCRYMIFNETLSFS